MTKITLVNTENDEVSEFYLDDEQAIVAYSVMDEMLAEAKFKFELGIIKENTKRENEE